MTIETLKGNSKQKTEKKKSHVLSPHCPLSLKHGFMAPRPLLRMKHD